MGARPRVCPNSGADTQEAVSQVLLGRDAWGAAGRLSGYCRQLIGANTRIALIVPPRHCVFDP